MSDPASLPVDHLGGPDGAPRLVLVHGFTQTSRCWSPFADDLARELDVVAVDAPGHGRAVDIRADLVAGARLLGEAGGRATYLGYSMGGRLALHLALQAPELVERLVLIGATAGIVDETERAQRRRADDELADHIEDVGVATFLDEWLAQPLFAGLRPETAHLGARLANTAEGLASSLRLAGTGTQEPLWDDLPRLSMPVLVLAGVDDPKFSAVAARMAKAIGPNTTVALVPRAGHSAHLENPGDTASIVRRWLRTHPGMAPPPPG
ncbi:alpha/beta fold hydrolase [Rhabdothermincola salaria]|uniref:alpha/beta fold hydrolase n=1 Tax=Rhabdothermincola salaria TaxID=2903142 RepID=UPI001E38568F|nr:alpha/beta fold hydrolase [Rhabdothermincola salaria]